MSTDDELVEGLRELDCHDSADRIVALKALVYADDGKLTWKHVAQEHMDAFEFEHARATAAERERDDLKRRLDEALTVFANGAYEAACTAGGNVYQHALALTVEKLHAAERERAEAEKWRDFWRDYTSKATSPHFATLTTEPRS